MRFTHNKYMTQFDAMRVSCIERFMLSYEKLKDKEAAINLENMTAVQKLDINCRLICGFMTACLGEDDFKALGIETDNLDDCMALYVAFNNYIIESQKAQQKRHFGKTIQPTQEYVEMVAAKENKQTELDSILDKW